VILLCLHTVCFTIRSVGIDGLWIINVFIYLDHEPCGYCITYDVATRLVLYRMLVLILLLYILLIYSTRQLNNIVLPFVLTMITNWLLARYCNTIKMWYEIDILTMYFLFGNGFV
jgi:hypothetical protein